MYQGNELNGPGPFRVDKPEGTFLTTFLTLDWLFKQVTEFPELQWIAKLATVSHRHSSPPSESSKREDANALPFGS